MAKTSTKIKIQGAVKIASQEMLIKNVICSTKTSEATNYDLAKRILEKTGKEGLLASKHEENATELGISQNKYYMIIGKLKRAGLIYRVNDDYFLSKGFSLRCIEMADIWDEYCRGKKKFTEESKSETKQ